MVVGNTFRKLADQKNTANAWGDWDPKEYTVEDSAFGYIVMENGAVIVLESSWALNIAKPNEAKFLLCGDKGGLDTLDGVKVNYVKNNRQVIEIPDMNSGGVAFYDGDGDVDPSVLDAKRRQHPGELFPGLRNTAFVALVYQYMEPETLRSYHAVIDIADDGERATQKLLGAIERVSAPADGGERNELSEREKEVLVALARGRINKEIAEMLNITETTSRTQLSRARVWLQSKIKEQENV